MAVQYANALKDQRMTDVLNAIDGGGAAGTIEVCTSGYTAVLCVLTLHRPSFVEANQMLTMQGVPMSGTAAASGVAAAARIKDSGGNVQVNGLTVGAGTGDMNLNSVSITSGQTVTLNSGTITHS